MTRGKRATALAALMLATSGASPAWGEPLEAFHAGSQAVTLAGGYAIGLPVGAAEGTEVEDVRMGALLPSWSIGLTDPLGAGAWYGGNVELLIEGALLFNTEPRDGFAGGVTANFRYNFVGAGRLVPYVEIGAGFGGVDFGLDKQADGFNFFLQAGLGARWFVTDHTAIGAGWRYHHISNASTTVPNFGIDSSLFLAGITLYLR